MSTSEQIAWARSIQTQEDAAVARFRDDLLSGCDWLDALLDGIAAWRTPCERHDGRDYVYLIAGEAFDWLLLAERLVESVDGLIPEREREELLFHGRPPRAVSGETLRQRLGVAKHHAILNYCYGVLVEDALQLAVEEEVRKSWTDMLRPPGSGLDDAVFGRIYGKTRQDLLCEFCAERRELPPDRITLGELREFTYWLFKYRVKHAEPARMASDTKKGIERLRRLGRGALDGWS